MLAVAVKVSVGFPRAQHGRALVLSGIGDEESNRRYLLDTVMLRTNCFTTPALILSCLQVAAKSLIASSVEKTRVPPPCSATVHTSSQSKVSRHVTNAAHEARASPASVHEASLPFLPSPSYETPFIPYQLLLCLTVLLIPRLARNMN